MAVIQTRLTSDNKQHDEAFKKSRQQVYNYKKTTTQAKDSLLSFAKGLGGKLVPALGLAGGAFEVFNKLIKSTEQSSDTFDKQVYTLKNSVDKFFQAIASGDSSGFIGQLESIKKTAQDAYEALDKLGTSKMWKNARIQQYQSEIEKLKTDTALGGDKKENDRLIKIYQQRINSLTESLTDEIEFAAKSVLDKILGFHISEDWGKKLIEMWENKTLESYMVQYKKNHQKLVNKTVSGGGYTYTVQQLEWDSEKAKKYYDGLNRLFTTVEKESLQEYYNLLTEGANREIEQARKERKNLGGTETPGGSGKEKGLTDKEQLEIENEYLKTLDREVVKYYALMQTERGINEEKIKATGLIEQEITLTDELSRANERYDASLENILSHYEDYNDKLTEITNLQLESIKSLGDAFSNLGNAFDLKGLNIVGIISEAIANIIKGFAEAQAKSAITESPWAWLAFSAAGLAQITSVISQIHSLSGYANGGIVGGNSYSGDRVLARVNSGEMILNGAQQSKLFSMLNTGGTTGNGNVVFKISGNDLVGVLNNYNKKVGRVI